MALQSFLIISSTRKVCKILNMVSVISFCKDKTLFLHKEELFYITTGGKQGAGVSMTEHPFP